MSLAQLRTGVVLLVLLSASPALSQSPAEPTFTLDFDNVPVVDVVRALEVMLKRPIAREGLERRTLTILTRKPLPARDLIPVTSFAMSLVGLSIAETPGGELRVQKVVGPGGVCARQRADVGRLIDALARGRDASHASFHFVDAPTLEVLGAMAAGLEAVIAVNQADRPSGQITLSSGVPLRLGDAYRLLFAALAREGNAVLEGPSGSFAVIGCYGEPRQAGVSETLPRLLGTLVVDSSALALVDENVPLANDGGAWSDIRRVEPGDVFEDGATRVAQIQREALVLQRPEGCAMLAVGESGRGRNVACPQKRSGATGQGSRGAARLDPP